MEVLASRLLVHPADFAASVRFYDDVLGLHRAREFGRDGRITGVAWFVGGSLLEVSGDGQGEGLAAGSARLWLQVRDVDAEHARVAALGAAVLAPPETMPWGLRECEIADPDGLRIVLVQVPEDHPLRRRT
jgi:catechol 2,3-dioxygenase-like lactoylglutathione lyase family enzyme